MKSLLEYQSKLTRFASDGASPLLLTGESVDDLFHASLYMAAMIWQNDPAVALLGLPVRSIRGLGSVVRFDVGFSPFFTAPCYAANTIAEKTSEFGMPCSAVWVEDGRDIEEDKYTTFLREKSLSHNIGAYFLHSPETATSMNVFKDRGEYIDSLRAISRVVPLFVAATYNNPFFPILRSLGDVVEVCREDHISCLKRYYRGENASSCKNWRDAMKAGAVHPLPVGVLPAKEPCISLNPSLGSLIAASQTTPQTNPNTVTVY